MKKILISVLLILAIVFIASYSLSDHGSREQEDAMRLEGMMPKEDNATIDAMMKKTEENAKAMEQKDLQASTRDGDYTVYSESAVSSALASGTNVILFFHAPWCPTCKVADTNFLKETPPKNTIIFKTDYDSHTDLRQKYGVTYQHTFVSLNTDGSLKKKSSGSKSFTELADLN